MAEFSLLIIFVAGYLFIVLEHTIKIDKAATALITGVLCWTVYILSQNNVHVVNEQLLEHFGEISGILFFLIGAMTIVELIDAHRGFDIVTSVITTQNKRKILWITALIAFFFSALLDNLTTTIVLISLLKKIVKSDKDRILFAGMVVIAANAGGAWSPIGDVTTTMLWIGGQITHWNIIQKLILPSLVCLFVPTIILSFSLKGNFKDRQLADTQHDNEALPLVERNILFFTGLGVLLMVPVFKTLTHLPPFMGILLGLAILWVVTSFLHKPKEEKQKSHYSVVRALKQIDTSSILFFLGILLSITALQSIGVLSDAAKLIQAQRLGDGPIAIIVGLVSSVIDNVPLVAAMQGMFTLQQYPTDHFFWEFLAYTTGTGGSILIIGSAAGIVAMGMEKITFAWYLKKIGWVALIGFLAGACVYMLLY